MNRSWLATCYRNNNQDWLHLRARGVLAVLAVLATAAAMWHPLRQP